VNHGSLLADREASSYREKDAKELRDKGPHLQCVRDPHAVQVAFDLRNSGASGLGFEETDEGGRDGDEAHVNAQPKEENTKDTVVVL